MAKGTEEVLARVRSFIALSASSSENEARNAAIAACRLIREHDLEIAAPRRAEQQSVAKQPLDWRPVPVGVVPPPCDLRYQGCPNAAAFALASVDHGIVMGHLCADHVPGSPRPRAKKPGRAARPPAGPPTPMDIARGAASAAGESFGRHAAAGLGDVLRSVLSGRSR